MKKLIAIIFIFTVTAVFAATVKRSSTRDFPLHSAESAPESSQAIAEGYQKKLGAVPNVVGVMAEAPALLNSYVAIQQNLGKMGTLTPQQNNVVQMAISRENECFY